MDQMSPEEYMRRFGRMPEGIEPYTPPDDLIGGEEGEPEEEGEFDPAGHLGFDQMSPEEHLRRFGRMPEGIEPYTPDDAGEEGEPEVGESEE